MANEAENTLPLGERREPTPDVSDEGSSHSDGSTEYESEEHLTPRPQKRPHGGEEDDPDFDPRGETRCSRAEPRVDAPDDDTVTPRLGSARYLTQCSRASCKYIINASFFT